MADVRIIKKYPNRRLYDTQISSYITLEDVRELIMKSEEFKVVDAKTGDDITRSVMLQIIAEHEERGQPLFSTNLLAQFIRFYGDALQGLMGSYLEKSMDMFTAQQSQFRKQIDNLMGQSPWSMMNDLTENNLKMWRDFQDRMFASANSDAADKDDEA